MPKIKRCGKGRKNSQYECLTMNIKFVFVAFLLLWNISGFAQEKVYSIEKNKDFLISGIGIGLNVLGYSLNEPTVTSEGINALNPDALWSIDRPAIFNYSASARTWSDIVLYTALSLPITLYADKKTRDQGIVIGLMGLEIFLISNGITHLTKIAAKRYRPFIYNPDVLLEEKLSSKSRLSFFSGHTSATSALSFFAAKVITDLRPDSKYKWAVWSAGATLPALVGYLRFEGGKHFFTDVAAGYVVGAVIGYMIPAVHLNKNVNLGLGLAGTLDVRYTF